MDNNNYLNGWIRNDMENGLPSNTLTVEEQNKEFSKSLRFEKISGIMIIVSVVLLLGCQPITGIIWFVFFRHLQSKGVIVAIYLVLCFALLIASFYLYYQTNGKATKLLKGAVDILLKQSFDITFFVAGKDGRTAEAESVFQNFHILTPTQATQSFTITDPFEGTRNHINFLFYDIVVNCYCERDSSLSSRRRHISTENLFTGQMLAIPMQQAIEIPLKFGMVDTDMTSSEIQCMRADQYEYEHPLANPDASIDILRHLRNPNNIFQYEEILKKASIDPDEFKSVLYKLKTHLKCPFLICLSGSAMFIILKSGRDLFEVNTQSKSAGTGVRKGKITFDEAVSQAREDIGWIAGIIDIMTNLKEHGLA